MLRYVRICFASNGLTLHFRMMLYSHITLQSLQESLSIYEQAGVPGFRALWDTMHQPLGFQPTTPTRLSFRSSSLAATLGEQDSSSGGHKACILNVSVINGVSLSPLRSLALVLVNSQSLSSR